ncbi:MAG: alpha/beta hydrolase [Gammaproteobacteria bacterium]|nr:alpha/beta hydrolase [Gammaproteobacteria bacterium]
MSYRLILLRGLGRDQLHWQPLLEALHKTLPDWIIETPDIPGAGILYQQSAPLNLDDYIKPLEQQVSQSFDGTTVVLGLSLGGMLALTWAKQRPELFNRVIAVNSSSRLTTFYRRLLVYKVWKYPGALARWSMPIKENAIYHLTCNRRPMPEGLLKRWVDIQNRHPVSVVTQLRQIWAAFKFKPAPADQMPEVSIISSKSDRLVDYRCSVNLASHYKTEVIFHTWAGHDLPQDDPVWLAETLKSLF